MNVTVDNSAACLAARPVYGVTSSTQEKPHEADVGLSVSSPSGSPLDVKPYTANPLPATGAYDQLGTGTTALKVPVVVDAGRYARNGVIRARAETVLVGNGSDTVAWLSDPQYYSHFQDLAPTYGTVMNYAAGLFRNKKISYFTNTGDIVEDQTRPADSGGVAGGTVVKQHLTGLS